MASASAETITIDRRFCGPPVSGNGGWTAGAVAELLDGSAEVTLRRPPPLDTPMTVARPTADTVVVSTADGIVAEARATDRVPDVAVPLVSNDDASTAGEAFLGAIGDHPFPTCFVCGPDRTPGDGLRLFPGPVAGRPGIVAGTWTPAPSLAGRDGALDRRAVWAALDCPGGLAHMLAERPCVLGRIAVGLRTLPEIGTRYTVIGWSDPPDGRKLPAHTAIVDRDDGTVLAVASSTWIEVDPADFR